MKRGGALLAILLVLEFLLITGGTAVGVTVWNRHGVAVSLAVFLGFLLAIQAVRWARRRYTRWLREVDPRQGKLF